MSTLGKILYEAFAQAFQQLRGNKLRSLLSLLGITIGIFCIIAVKSSVDSLESNIRGSFDKLGSDVLYVKKFSWSEPPHNNWWKYLRRPHPTYDDYEVIRKKVHNAAMTSYHVLIGFKTLKYRSSSVERSLLLGITYDFVEMFKVDFEKGRYFSSTEYYYGSNKIILGHAVAEELFGPLDPIGKDVKLMGRHMEVIGVIEKAGKDLINPLDFDDAILVSYPVAKTLANLKSRYIFDSTVNIKAAEDVSLDQLKDEVTGVLRAHRHIKPREEANFAINELTMLSSILDSFFGALNLAGFIIGIFAIFVGMFSVANIMFVSVKERTSFIGIKKALGAKRYIILLEFLIESIILCILGGLVGLCLVFLVLEILSGQIGFEIYLSGVNVIWGIGASVIIGVISGLIPAMQAARMDPVEAMRK